jgi:hypothetical protein
LDAAQAWGTPPWVLAGGRPLLWYLRYEAYRQAQGEAAELKKQQAAQEAWFRGL